MIAEGFDNAARQSMRHVLVENLAGFEAARTALGTGSDTIWHTSSAFLLERLSSEGFRVVSVERLVNQGELNRLGEISLEIVRGWREALDTSEFARECGIPFGRVVSPQLKLLLVVLLARAVILDRWVREIADLGGEAWVAGPEGLSPVAVNFCRFRDSDALFRPLLARTSWRERIGLVTAGDASGKPLASPEVGSRRRILRLLPALNASRSKVAYALWRRYGPRGLRLPWKGGSVEVLLFGNNELIKESFIPLLRRGARITLLPTPIPQPKGEAPGHVADLRLAATLRAGFLQTLPEPTECLEAAASLAVDRLISFLEVFVPYVADARKALSDLKREPPHPRVVLSHGLTDPVELLVYQLVREAGIPVIEVQHGGSAGLTHAHIGYIELAEINACQASVVYNENFRAYYQHHLGERMPPPLVSGAPEITQREVRPAISRRLARRLLGIGSRERLVIYATNMLQGNSLSMPYGHLDTHYYQVLREIVCEVFAKVPATCLVKLYPPAQSRDPHPLLVCPDLPPNVRLEERLDFRYLRLAADVVVLDVPYSTLAWTLGVDVPAILLDLSFNPLLPEVVPVIEEALFRVDCAQPGWQEQLRGLLDMPQEMLAAEWRRRAPRRRAFVERCVLGPPGRPGERIAEFTVRFPNAGERPAKEAGLNRR